MSVKEYYLPGSLDEAVNLLAEYGPSLLVMAGGTLAMPLINEGVSFPERVMGLRRAGLDTIERTNGSFIMGAATTFSQVLEMESLPLLQQAAGNVGSWAVRNLATVGGNLFAPPPAGDFAVALLALDADVTLASKAGERTLPLGEFYTGFMTTALRPDELVSRLSFPAPRGVTVYLKYGRKHANTPAVVTVAAQVVLEGDVVTDARLALNAVGPYPFRAAQVEQALVGSPLTDASILAAAQAAAQESQPFTDAVASEWYRRKMVEVFVRRALEQVAG